MSQPFQLRLERLARRACVVTVMGDLDLANAPEVRRAISTALGEGERLIVIDLSEADFVDSSGLGALTWAQLRARAAGGDVRVAGAHDDVIRAIALANLDTVLSLDDNRDASLAQLGVSWPRVSR
jgi:anti-sigma B factor antagonist